MACPEMGQMYMAMTVDMGQKLSGYSMSLQSRYGDPRVYAQQQEQMARDQAAVAHSKSQKTAQLLEDAYERQKERNRVQHNTRINTRSGSRSVARPESVSRPSSRTAEPPAAAVAHSNSEHPSETA